MTTCKPFTVTKTLLQPLDNLQENEFPADALSVISQSGKNYCSAIKFRSARVKGERQMTKKFGKIHYHYHNTNFSNLDTKDNFTIPVMYMIYLLTASGLPRGGSCTIHIYTQSDTKQTIYRATQNLRT